ncbi:actin-related protein 2/3 complex, subunit 1 [Piedraia hortae CBS 480.64]|uniref:Actin-related protein 2/3 complex subunit n=1 Tax=Piedraia hortae CBS 480.64 TaxID=1314780 RepID=A0A6A7C1C5_9PEZI|nr:actin-related protein 2/3 complex, subunit 1 [Piedraia hortae CBS 480.64]
MAHPEIHHLFREPISDHAFSQDHKTLAVTRDNRVELYRRVGKVFELQDELRGHDKLITGVDIAPNSGRIVTCSQDRNAYVWEASAKGEYKPTLVLLRINRAATCVRWSPDEKKFAVGSGARIIATCYFEAENDWWVSKHVKKPLRSTVISIAWHPNSVLLAAGSTDGHARVFSAFIKGVDERPPPSAWGERLPFNTVCGEYLNPTAGWVRAVGFSPSGNALAYAGHDSTVTVVYPSAPDQPPQAVISVATQYLPFNSLLWASETELVCAGFDCGLYRFSGDASGWQLVGPVEKPARAGPTEACEDSAINMFRSMDLKGRAAGTEDDTKLKTVHQNAVNTIRLYSTGSVSTGGVDGRVVIWNLS